MEGISTTTKKSFAISKHRLNQSKYLLIETNTVLYRIRGFLGSLLNLSTTSGMLGAYISGAFMDYAHVPLVILPFPVIFLLSMIILPETPISLLRRNKIEVTVHYYSSVKTHC